jgi:hypothetical protein
VKHVDFDKTIIRYNIKIYHENMRRKDVSSKSLSRNMDQW